MTCGIIFPRHSDLDDATGCMLGPAHSDSHLCRDREGRLWRWRTDMECDCSDCQSDDPDDWCIVYARADIAPKKPRAKRVLPNAQEQTTARTAPAQKPDA